MALVTTSQYRLGKMIIEIEKNTGFLSHHCSRNRLLKKF